MFEKIFSLRYHKTNIKTELLAGLTTFLTMGYILAVNPNILSITGMNKQAIFVATCLAASFGSLIMALVANWPIGMAPSMGLNSFFAYTVVIGMGYTWQEALGAVFLSGVIFLIITATGIRSWLIKGIPTSLRSGITAGIGMFLAIISLKTSGIITHNEATLLSLGNLNSVAPILTFIGLLLIIILETLRIRGAILISILTITTISFLIHVNKFQGLMSFPPSLTPTFLQLDILGALNKGIVHVLLVFILVEVFDATGTLIAIGKKADLLNKKKNTLDKALFSDSTAILAGSLIGTSSTTAYVESTAGVIAGGRTGLTALCISILFLLSLFFSPLILSIPTYATTAALLFVSCLMMREFSEIQWDNLTDSAPACLTALLIPFSYSVATGLAFGFITYTIVKIMSGHIKEIHPATGLIAIIFTLRFLFS